MCRRPFRRQCAECGVDFIARDNGGTAAFCSAAHRTAWNNRQRERGARLLGLYLHQRFNRAEAQARGVKTLVDRMVSNWVAEDRAAGRRAMRPLDDCLQAAVADTALHHRVGPLRIRDTGVRDAVLQ